MDDENKSKADLNKIWEDNMHDFVPEEFITFEIDEGKSIMLLDKIHHTKESLPPGGKRVKIRGTYYVVGGTEET